MDTTDCYGYLKEIQIAMVIILIAISHPIANFCAHSHVAKMEIYTNGFEAVETTRRSFQNAF